jgi:two pore calcium channel protein 2
MMLAFFEKPSSLSVTSDISNSPSDLVRYEFLCSVLQTIDMFCLFLFVIDASAKSYLVNKKRILRSPWLIAYYLVLAVSIIDCSISLLMNCDETFRVRRYLRPFFLIQSSSLMKKTIKCVRRTVPQIISVLVLLIINLYFFAIIGMLVFPRYYIVKSDIAIINTTNTTNSTETTINYRDLFLNGNSPISDDNHSHKNDTSLFVKNKVFSNIASAIVSLIYLVTSSNNPDVMMQAYSQNRFSAIFFIIYVVIGLYCIMSLVTAVIYNQFKGFFQDSLKTSAFRQSLALRAAFFVLYDSLKDEAHPGKLSKLAVKWIVQNLSISKKIKKNIIKNMEKIDNNNTSNANNVNSDDIITIDQVISLDEFEQLFSDMSIYDENLDNDSIDTTAEENERRMSTSSGQLIFGFKHWLERCRLILKKIFEWKWYMHVSCWITIGNIFCITAELHIVDELYVEQTHIALSFVILAISVFYFIENSLKIWALKWKVYSHNNLNLADGCISFVFFILQLTHLGLYKRPYLTLLEMNTYINATSIWGLSRVVNMFMIIRLIYLSPSIRVMNAILSTFIDILRSLRPIFGVIVVIYYVFALLGMELFKNKIRLDSYNKTVGETPDDDNYCGSYAQLDYWPNNFNDFGVKFFFFVSNRILIEIVKYVYFNDLKNRKNSDSLRNT